MDPAPVACAASRLARLKRGAIGIKIDGRSGAASCPLDTKLRRNKTDGQHNHWIATGITIENSHNKPCKQATTPMQRLFGLPPCRLLNLQARQTPDWQVPSMVWQPPVQHNESISKPKIFTGM